MKELHLGKKSTEYHLSLLKTYQSFKVTEVSINVFLHLVLKLR